MNSHDSGSDRPNDWNSRRNIGTRRDYSSDAPKAEDSGRRLGVATHRLTQVLGRVEGLREVGGVVVRHVARCVRSRFATFAVPNEQNQLEIVATFGYPLDLVRTLRIATGAGVVGSVYEKGAPLLVQDVTTVAGLRRRPRYRTNSFIAVPISAGPDVLGVLCVADRLDDQPFSREDLGILRTLAAPAALAMARERARQDAEGFARAAVTALRFAVRARRRSVSSIRING